MIEFDDMRSFVEVVESGGFGRAAKRLGVSKSIVSRRVARIEADLGTVLLNRTTRNVSPTEAGLEFKARAQRILAEFEAAREAVAAHDDAVVGRLRLTAPQSFGVRHVAPVLAELAREHPLLHIDASFGDGLRDLVAEGFDAAIRIGNLRDSTLIARRLAPARSLLVASPAYLEQRGRPKVPSDLAAHDALLYAGKAGVDWQLRDGDRWVSVHPTGRLRSDSGDTLLEWAIAGLGIAELPTFLLSDALESGAIKPVLADYPLPHFAIYVVRPPGGSPSAKVRALIDKLVTHFGGEPHWDKCLLHERAGRRITDELEPPPGDEDASAEPAAVGEPVD